MLRQRIITAAVILPLVIAIILGLPNSYFILVAMLPLLVIGGWEWSRLIKIVDLRYRSLYVVALLAVALLAYYLARLFPHIVVNTIVTVALLWWLIALLLLSTYTRKSVLYERQPWIAFVAGFVVLVSAWWFLGKLHSFNPEGVLYLILLTVIADTAAYFSGKKYGKHKLAPELSPGKTIEGVMGAVIGVLLWAIVGGWYFHIPPTLWISFIFLSLITMVFSVAGDLWVSLMKRESGFKDSGTILPGHGGILDRVDSQLAALPIFVSGLILSGLQGL